MSLALVGLQGPLETGKWLWYHYIAVWFFGPLAVLLSLRVLYRFKVLYVKKGQFEAWFPFRFVRRKWNIEELNQWREDRVKTGRTVFREMVLQFDRMNIKLSNRENTNYEKLFDYLSRKAGKKRDD